MKQVFIRVILLEIVKSGIEGLDAMLYGGFPKEDQVMIAGGPGAGKTLIAFEYIYRNAKQGNKGIFFALEEDPKKIVQNAQSAFSNLKDIGDLVDKGMIMIEGKDLLTTALNKYDEAEFGFGRMVSEMESSISESGATRVVIDSSSAFELVIKDPVLYRRSMWSLAANLRRLGVTTVFTSETRNPDRKKLVFNSEHFIFDGMILMYQSGEAEKRIHTLEIIKMRGHNHSFVTAPYEITPDGFKIFSPELMLR